MFRCTENGKDYQSESDGMYSRGDWISWDWINDQLAPKKVRKPRSAPNVRKIFNAIARAARSYYAMTGRYLEIWGELGELYAEAQYGIERHTPSTAGSDGRIGDDLVEIKTISPTKHTKGVRVRRKGNFTKLVAVKISSDLKFESRIIDRSTFCKPEQKPTGKAMVAWRSMPEGRRARLSV